MQEQRMGDFELAFLQESQLLANSAAVQGSTTTETSATELADNHCPDGSVAATEAEVASAWVVLTLALTLALGFSFLCSIFESVLLSVNRGRVEAMAKEGGRSGKILKRWKRSDIEVPIAAILILNTLAHTVGATVAGSSYKTISPETLGIFSLVFTLAVLILTEIIPKTLGVTFANRLAAPVTMAVWVLTKVLFPFLKLTSAISKALTGEHKKPVTSVEEIRLLAALGRHEGDVGPRFAALIEGAASLRELTVHDVMVPRGGVAYLSSDKTLEENLEIVRQSAHSRFPFTPTGELDDVEGVILAKDLLFHEHDKEEPETDWSELQSPMLVVTETKALDEMLRLFQEKRQHLAVVVDEYGGTQGVVTLEDVLEEIVGEIEDETDQVEKLIVRRADGSLRCRGMAETRKVFKVLGIEEKTDMVTVGGLVGELLGRVPKVDDVVTWKNLQFRVSKASARRAERVEVSVVDAAAEDAPEES